MILIIKHYYFIISFKIFFGYTFFQRKIMENKDLIEQTKKHIQQLRSNTSVLEEREFRIALGKLFIELKDAKKHDSDILKKLFTFS